MAKCKNGHKVPKDQINEDGLCQLCVNRKIQEEKRKERILDALLRIENERHGEP